MPLWGFVRMVRSAGPTCTAIRPAYFTQHMITALDDATDLPSSELGRTITYTPLILMFCRRELRAHRAAQEPAHTCDPAARLAA